jgi:hypothetical protein
MLTQLSLDVIKVNTKTHPDLKGYAGSLKDTRSAYSRVIGRSDTTLSSSDSGYFRSETLRRQDSSGEASENTTYLGHPAQHALLQTREWRLQRRSSSESSTQPYSAPSGLEAQKADNFKKFFQAVVSPSHVRVTAGGRIVPNPRGPPQPMFTWSTEKGSFEQANSSEAVNSAGNSPETRGNWSQGVQLDSANRHTLNGLGRTVHDYVFGPPLQAPTSKPPGPAPEKRNVNSSTASIADNDFASEGPLPPVNGQIKLSPPDQFDLSRPFMHNGQMVYPMPPGFRPPPQTPVLPVSILGNLNSFSQPFGPSAGMAMPASMQLQGNLQYAQAMAFANQQSSSMNAPCMMPLRMPTQLHSMAQLPNALSVPSQSSFIGQPLTALPSPAVLCHNIQILQHQLKTIDDQLQNNNNNQSDMQILLNQRNFAHAQIVAFQSTLNAQLSSSAPSMYDQPGSSAWSAGLGITEAPVDPVASPFDAAGTKPNPSDLCPLKGVAAAEKEPSEGVKINSSPTSGSPDTEPPAKPASNSRERLRAAAAMAPPFQPRSQQVVASEASSVDVSSTLQNWHDDTKVLSQANESAAEAEARLMAAASDWTTPSNLTGSEVMHGPYPVPRANASYHGNSGSGMNYIPATFNHPHSFLVSAASGPRELPHAEKPKPAVPYLVGFAPSGMGFGRQNSSELVYSRELTDEERRARHLYWGKAPREASKGLPKFDGRDFYPPSPVKASDASKMETADTQLYAERPTDIRSNFHQLTAPTSRQSVENLNLRQVSDSFTNHSNSSAEANQLNNGAIIANEKSVENDEKASLDSWGLSKEEEEEIFTPTVTQLSSFMKDSSFRRSSSTNSTPPVTRYDDRRKKPQDYADIKE